MGRPEAENRVRRGKGEGFETMPPIAAAAEGLLSLTGVGIVVALLDSLRESRFIDENMEGC